ncbi:hypothetical protein [Streptomyces sp. SID14515]|uniref:hypothetical protein n=1 Tax=Streptomyces sp. SID14515 TaxID=2706074 RepID=UPI0013C95502|nr:hypothetical protein [Streptomyces sp. SID14515]NEB42586.1 hypothetical protein [Streptomyces sp. SID14515]
MQIQRTKHVSDFTIVPNAILKHRTLSLTARGLLGLLISLPEFTEETVRELTEGVEEGQKRVTNAMKELQAAGYVVCTRVQNERGHWSTHVTVFDLPQLGAPETASPKPGRPKRRLTGLTPFGGKNQEKNPPAPQESEELGEYGQTQDMHHGEGAEAPQIQEDDQELGRAAALLGRLATAEVSLALSAADVMKLAPLAAQWLQRGVSELQLRNELVGGLPATIKSPRALLADRLTRKMPAVPVKAEPLAECGDCRGFLPRGQQAGICSRCAGLAPAITEPAPVGQTEEASSLLAAIRQRRASGQIKGTSRRGFATVAV